MGQHSCKREREREREGGRGKRKRVRGRRRRRRKRRAKRQRKCGRVSKRPQGYIRSEAVNNQFISRTRLFPSLSLIIMLPLASEDVKQDVCMCR